MKSVLNVAIMHTYRFCASVQASFWRRLLYLCPVQNRSRSISSQLSGHVLGVIQLSATELALSLPKSHRLNATHVTATDTTPSDCFNTTTVAAPSECHTVVDNIYYPYPAVKTTSSIWDSVNDIRITKLPYNIK